jgi:hypothetical protein
MGSEREDVFGPISGLFRPPAKGSLERWLGQITEIGWDVVKLDGRELPRVREATGAPWREEAERLGVALDVLEELPAGEIADLVLDHHTIRAIERETPLRPARNPRLCLEASYLRRIEAVRLGDIGPRYGLVEQVDTKSVRRFTARGDLLFASLGAWPWALYEGGKLPVRWRQSDLVARELAEWHARARDAALQEHVRQRGRLRRAAELDGPST